MARQLRMPSAKIAERLQDLCELTRLPANLLDNYPAELSGGQRQRVSLMRALMLLPDVLLLDEPLGALDPMVRATLQTDLKSIFQRVGQTVIMVTHDLAEAAFLADHIVLMTEGQVVQQGSYAELRDNPTSPFVTDFIRAQRSLVDL
jgi:osmoprotectant transport system ATP-binding protein